MYKKIIVSSITALALIAVIGTPIVYTTDAEAKGFRSSSRSFSSSSFSSSKSSRSTGSFWKSSKTKTASYKAKSKPTSYKATTKKKASFTSNKVKSTKGAKSTKRTFTSSQKAKNSKLALNQQRNKFKKSSTFAGKSSKPRSKQQTRSRYKSAYSSNPTYSRASQYDRNTYYSRRNTYYGSGYNPPVYVYNSSPSYGLWDTVFLYSMLNNNNSSQFAYNHQNDRDYRMWRKEANRQAEDNADLRAKLNSMDANMKSQSGRIDPSYLPKGVDADIAMSQEARNSQLPDFNVCVGGENGAYHRVTANVFIPNISEVNVVPITTSGSGEILDKIVDGSCDAGWAQSDSYWNYTERHNTLDLPFSRVFSPYKETVHLVCNVGSGYSNVSNLDKNTKLYFPRKSGAEETWTNFIAEDDDYADIQTPLNNARLTVSSNQEAFLKINGDKNACALYVALAGKTKLMRDVEAQALNGSVVLLQVNDSDFNDTTDPSGNDVYDFTKIPQKVYPNLSRKAGMLWGGGSIKTLQLNADFLISDKWKNSNKELYSKVAFKLVSLNPQIQNEIR